MVGAAPRHRRDEGTQRKGINRVFLDCQIELVLGNISLS